MLNIFKHIIFILKARKEDSTHKVLIKNLLMEKKEMR